MDRKKVLIIIIILTALIALVVCALNSSTSYRKLSVSEEKWHSIISDRNENDKLLLESIKFNDYSLVIDEKNSTIYYSLVNESNSKYNPSVAYDAFDENAKLAILQDEITDEKVMGRYQFKIMIYNDSEYNIYNLVCTEFPILNIGYNKKADTKNIPMELHLFDNLRKTPNRILKSAGRLNIVNDKTYTFSLLFTSPGKNVRENKQPIFNMDPHNEYILTKAENAYNSQAHLVELFINNQYIGLYFLRQKTQ